MIARLDEFRVRFQLDLDRVIAARLERTTPLCNDPFLSDVLGYLAEIGRGQGKRIRPYTAWLAFDALGGKTEIEDALVALELFHLFCLVHDDVIDRGTQRYGIPTIQHYVQNQMIGDSPHAGHLPSRAAHVGLAQALLLGDLLFAWAQESFDLDDVAPTIRHRARALFRTMIDEVLVGQMIDVDMTARRATSLETIRRKLVLKTASYTFIRPLQIGAALAGDGAHAQFFHDLGLALGLAFQLQDDWLDISGAPSQTRKTFLSDLREGQHTYFTQYVFEHATQNDQAELRQILGAELDETDRPRIAQFFERTGALGHGREEIDRHLEQARALLGSDTLPLEHRAAFLALIASLETRFELSFSETQ